MAQIAISAAWSVEMADQTTPDRAPDDRRAARRGDEADLYRQFNGRLVGIVGKRVNTSPDIVEDACAFAWLQFVRHQPDRNRAWRAWLVKTAEREAWSLHRAEARHVAYGLDAGTDDELHMQEPVDPVDRRSEYLDAREALAALAEVPERRRRAKALHILGYTHAEIGPMLGVGHARVNHLIREANDAVRDVRAQTAERAPLSERAARLQELEADPPAWLTRAVGFPGSLATRKLAWRRAALAIDDFRREHGAELGDDLLRDRPTEPMAARSFDLARRSAQRVRVIDTRGLER